MEELDLINKPVDEMQSANGLSNGIANGTSESEEPKELEHKSKDRDKDKHRDKDRHKSSHKDKDRDKSRDKERHSSSHKSSHKDRDKDKERSKDKDRDHKDKSSRDKDKDRSRDHKSKDDKYRNKDRSDKDKDKERSKDKERRDKDRERSDKHKDKDRSKDKDRHKHDKDRSSSQSKDRHHSSHKSSHKDKHRDKDRDKEKHQKIKTEVKDEKVKEEFPQNVPAPMETAEEESKPYDNPPMKEEFDEEEDSKLVIKEEVGDENDSEDDVSLASRKRIKVEVEDEDDDEDDKPLIMRKKVQPTKKRKKACSDDEDDEDFKPAKKVKKEKGKVKKEKVKSGKKKSIEIPATESPTKGGRKKKAVEEEHVWRWWEEEKRDDGRKWVFLEHKGPVFPDHYVRLPSGVKFYYNGEHMVLSDGAEEVAGFYARMLEHDYTTKEVFNKNFFKDWRKTMTAKEKEKIIDLKKCDFKRMYAYFVQQNENRKNRTKEEKKALKEANEKLVAEYGWCSIDGHKQKIGNFKIEPPGLFRGRGEHPKQGMVKKRTVPEDVIINCSKDSKIPVAPDGHKWKEVRHDSQVTWLACWNENIQGSTKYVMLNAASKLKGEKDWQKYQTARKLHKHVDRIRDVYRADWKSKEMRIRQRGVALYFIDKLALRAGNEKDEDQADTVGCCSLRVEHIKLHEQKNNMEYLVEFDFLGKDSIRYYNEVPVERRVFKNLQLFMENKQSGDDLFDRLNTQILNKYLNELLDGLTAKVFRTYNASRTLQEQLEVMTNPKEPLPAQILTYNRANREVAILCNHQRAVPKTFDKSMANLQTKINDKKDQLRQAKEELEDLKAAAKHGGTVAQKVMVDKKKKAIEKLKEQLRKLEISATDKEENKQIALGTSKLNYLDPRITVAWCKKNDIPIEKVFNKTHRQKFQWAIDMATADYNFLGVDQDDKSFSGGQAEDDDDDDDYE